MGKKKIVAEICLYGTWKVGHGWIAKGADGRMFGTGEPKPGRTCTEAYWEAALKMREEGYGPGAVKIFAPGGELMATTNLDQLPIYGALTWTPATMYAISVAALLAAEGGS